MTLFFALWMASFASDPPAKATPDAAGELKGRWKLVRILTDDRETIADELDGGFIAFTGSTYAFKLGTEVNETGICKFDFKAKPQRIDLTATKDKEKGKTYRGIFERKGDVLRICFGKPGDDEALRPKAFSSKAMTDFFILEFERDETATPDAVPKKAAKPPAPSSLEA